jgi:hypothetical protein
MGGEFDTLGTRAVALPKRKDTATGVTLCWGHVQDNIEKKAMRKKGNRLDTS